MPRYDLPRHIPDGDRRTEDILQTRPHMHRYTRRLLVDSRDATTTTAPFDFTVSVNNDLSRGTYKNIESVELKLAAIPKVADENYVALDIEQLRDSNLDGSNQATHDAFAVTFFDNSSLSAGDYKPIDKIFHQKAVFAPPIASLDKLHITVRKQDGNVVQTSETGNTEQVQLLMDVTMVHPW